MINNQELTLAPRLEQTTPLVTRERFAELVGLPVGVIVGFVNKGYLPVMSVGKYSLVNIELLRKRCLEKEFS
ncbi:regulatory phage cox family protein [Chromobacterium vaccinii]|uniref:regulatory phage cox family protein n=1 Tax=Chromobacterium vaccinii TaxID=1108595 RepID=UPI001E2D7112|nr:regulatory phage cox family protein [Chromobacterium vaccinii]MCD4484888.1 regulatory phage cox family protein [Chromobacterium vaccinii]